MLCYNMTCIFSRPWLTLAFIFFRRKWTTDDTGLFTLYGNLKCQTEGLNKENICKS